MEPNEQKISGQEPNEQELANTDRPEGETERFEIQDAAGANWYLRQLRNLETEKATIQAQTAAMLKQLDGDIHRLEFLYGQQFEMWVRAELARRGGRGKTLPLHQGTAAFRTVPRTLRVLNAREAIEYAQRQGWDVIKRVESLDADGYKKQAVAVMAETGEVLPGIEVIEERESFTVKFGATKDTKTEGEADL